MMSLYFCVCSPLERTKQKEELRRLLNDRKIRKLTAARAQKIILLRQLLRAQTVPGRRGEFAGRQIGWHDFDSKWRMNLNRNIRFKSYNVSIYHGKKILVLLSINIIMFTCQNYFWYEFVVILIIIYLSLHVAVATALGTSSPSSWPAPWRDRSPRSRGWSLQWGSSQAPQLTKTRFCPRSWLNMIDLNHSHCN